MFTGLVTHKATVTSLSRAGTSASLTLQFSEDLQLSLGDSVAVDGACLTVSQTLPGNKACFGISAETLSKTTIDHFKQGRLVNCELALAVGDRLGGHFVSGHVDGLGQVEEVEADGDFARFRINLPPALFQYLVPKGSVCINGVSLTVNEIHRNPPSFDITLIPATLEATNLANLQKGDEVNIECDMIAKIIRQAAEPYLREGKASESEA